MQGLPRNVFGILLTRYSKNVTTYRTLDIKNAKHNEGWAKQEQDVTNTKHDKPQTLQTLERINLRHSKCQTGQMLDITNTRPLDEFIYLSKTVPLPTLDKQTLDRPIVDITNPRYNKPQMDHY